jgi:hypothetical protein
VISYHKKILSNDINSTNTKETKYHKEKIVKFGELKKVVDFLFTFFIAILIFILFRPGDKKGIVLDFKTNILFKIAAITLLINADWDSLYLFIHPLVKKIE